MDSLYSAYIVSLNEALVVWRTADHSNSATPTLLTNINTIAITQPKSQQYPPMSSPPPAASASASASTRTHAPPDPGPSTTASISRPRLVKEVGSATISLRRGALGSDDDDEEEGCAVRAGAPAAAAVRASPSKGDRSGSKAHANTSTATSISASPTLPPPITVPPPPGSVTRVLSDKRHMPHSHSPATSSASPSPSRRRGRRDRSNSLHFPPSSAPPPSAPLGVGVGVGGSGKPYYLSHYSTDRAYSLAPGSAEAAPSSASARSATATGVGGGFQFELGLGDDFDQSFGEAMRNGISGEELPLPQQALRVLSQAKENGVSKKGRKGSLGMGLFRESRDGGGGGGGRDMPRPGACAGEVQDQVVVEEEEEEGVVGADESASASPPKTSASSSPFKQPSTSIPIPTSTSMSSTMPLSPLSEEVNNSLSSQTAAIRIVSSPLLRDESADAGGGSASYDESGWTTTGSDGSSTDMSMSEITSRDSHSHDHEFVFSADNDEDPDGPGQRATNGAEDEEGEEEEEEEEDEEQQEEGESMTVPLQPFDHAVGGHSSIYKFTRRAVCKVRPLSPFHATYRAYTKCTAAREPRKPLLRRCRTSRSRPTSLYTAIPRRHARQLSSNTPGRSSHTGCTDTTTFCPTYTRFRVHHWRCHRPHRPRHRGQSTRAATYRITLVARHHHCQ